MSDFKADLEDFLSGDVLSKAGLEQKISSHGGTGLFATRDLPEGAGSS